MRNMSGYFASGFFFADVKLSRKQPKV
ncbi:Protein of unknown function [Pyronema omphalodes CBS 100304]|uniref:Uncharacterized protein n=1 Tax=Pyronema omphalodes (strain CBS 100304) TaxID=1076935 RepID=U4L8P3_PYROM|nr:Protein of unknown function [Pyronema omphalodes CBS 100304]